jgi:hypothetical protein
MVFYRKVAKMKLRDYHDSLILERHEVHPSGYDLSKIAFKEEVFRKWCQRKERIRDIINMKREEQERQRNLREKMKSIGRLQGVLIKIGTKKETMEKQKLYMRTASTIKNGKE